MPKSEAHNEITKNHKKHIYFVFALLFLAGLSAGILGHNLLLKIKAVLLDEHAYYEIRKSGYNFINPLIECEPGAPPQELTNFRNKIRDFIKLTQAQEKDTNISVYFRDLNNGLWFGINEKEKFLPASLLKVPIMMAYLKKAETDPSVLNKQIRFETQISDLQQNFKPSQRLQLGQYYTVDELIDRMIRYSDNDAKDVLIENDRSSFNHVQKDLGLEAWDYDQPEEQMTTASYATLFRVLFNASYLSRDMSEKALQTLNTSEFKTGLAAGIPNEIKIAHKFGERYENWLWQLHDCGIIYYPDHPYLLCILTRGPDMQSLTKILKNISYMVYSEVEKQDKSIKSKIKTSGRN